MTTAVGRRPAGRRVLRWLAWVAVGVLVVVAVLGFRALRVVWSVEDHATYWTERAEQQGELLYVALGDSLAQGIGAGAPERGYVGLLADDLAAATGSSVRVVNVAVSGATAADVVADQLPLLDEMLVAGPRPALVTLDVGANDVGTTPPAQFEQDVARILDALPPGALVADVPDFGGGASQVEARRLSQVVRDQVSTRAGPVPVAVEEATTGMGLTAWSGDWFHPSDRGYLLYRGAFRAASDVV